MGLFSMKKSELSCTFEEKSMKKLSIAIIALVASLSLQAQDLYIFDDFRTIPWGTHKDSAFDSNGEQITFVKAKGANGSNAWEISEDDMNIGTVVMDRIIYIFTEEDQFEGVRMTGETAKSFHEMKYILIYKFGEAKIKDIPNGVLYSWIIDGVRINLTLNTLTDSFVVEFASDYVVSQSRKINRNINDF